MVRRLEAQEMVQKQLEKHNLWKQGWRCSFTQVTQAIAFCSYKYKRIVISVPHLNARSDVELQETILHEIAHALVGEGHGHNDVWKNKAIEIGLPNPSPCSPSNLEAGRALSPAQMKEARSIKSLEKICPKCGKVAVEVSRMNTGKDSWLKLACGDFIKKSNIKDVEVEIDNWISETGKKLYPYQAEGIKFVGRANGRALIADEPGLGKTMQAFGCLKFYPEMSPCLWVCKPSLKLQTLKEALDWNGYAFMGQIIETKNDFILPNMKLYIVSMDLLKNIPQEKLDEIPFKTIVADEIQHFKNPDSIRTAELRKLVERADYFIPLSGTPWKNRGSEYFSVLNMLRPELFPNLPRFKNQWVRYYNDPVTGKLREGGINDIPRFRKTTNDFIIRRMRDDVLPDLPPIERRVRIVALEEELMDEYNEQEGRVAAIIKAALIDGKSMASIGPIIMRLKHLTGQAKAPIVAEDAIEWLENSEDPATKLTIFHHHIDVGDEIQEKLDVALKRLGFNKTLRLFGGRGPEERNDIIGRFKNDINNRILIASTLASGEGLNIQFCQHAYMAERQWNPGNEEQAELRFSRPLTWGDNPPYLRELLFREDHEPKKVNIQIPYFIADGTVDSILTDIVDRKRLEFRKTMNDKDANLTWDEVSIMSEVAEAIMKKHRKNGKGKK